MSASCRSMFIKSIARTVYIAAIVAGGSITLARLYAALAHLDFRPTRGEVADAIRYLESRGKVTVTVPAGGWNDSERVVIEKTRSPLLA